MHRVGIACGLALLLLAGCGDSDGASGGVASGGGSEREQVEATVADYMQALANGDGRTACGRLTESAQRNLATGSGASSCEAGIEKLARSFDDRARETLNNARVSKTDINGARAKVTIASGQTRPEAPVPLEKAEGRWRLTGFPSGVNFRSQAEAECISEGMSNFYQGRTDPFWRKEGRADFGDYVNTVCRRADRSGARNRAAVERIAAEVVLEMVKRGQIRDPRR